MQFWNKIRKNNLLYTAILVLLAFGYNILLYNIGRILAAGKPHLSMESSLDVKIPLVSWMSFIYLGCYAFWGLNYFLAVYKEGKKGTRFLKAHFLGETIGFLFFVFLPTTMVRPLPAGNTFSEQVLLFIYRLDPADNLFPSFHCFVSWMCWIGVRRHKGIPVWYRYLSLFLALLVCVTVLTVKQHVIADVWSGIIIAELSYLLLSFLRV